MISSIFNKRKPAGFIIVIVYLFFYMSLCQYLLFDQEISFFSIASNLGMLLLLSATVFGVDLLNSSYNLSGKNAYIMLLFALSVSLFPQLLMAKNIVLSNIFVLLAMNRLLGLGNELMANRKIFEAALWISAAVLFYPWTILYFIMIYMAVVLYTPRNYKNWIIPLIAVAAVLMLRYTYFLWLENSSGFLSIFQFKIQWGYLRYSPSNYFLAFVFLTVIGFLGAIAYGVRAVKKRTLKQSTGFLIIISLLIGLSMVLFFGDPDKTVVIFMIFPLLVLFSNYLERLKKRWVREGFFWLFLMVLAVVLLLQFSAKSQISGVSQAWNNIPPGI